MATNLSGNTLLHDKSRNVVLRGCFHMTTDDTGRLEVHVTNDVTGISEMLVFLDTTSWNPIMQIVQALQDVWTDVDVGAPRLQEIAAD